MDKLPERQKFANGMMFVRTQKSASCPLAVVCPFAVCLDARAYVRIYVWSFSRRIVLPCVGEVCWFTALVSVDLQYSYKFQ